jgi:hypothetical protein
MSEGDDKGMKMKRREGKQTKSGGNEQTIFFRILLLQKDTEKSQILDQFLVGR